MYTNGMNKPIAANRFARHGMRNAGFLSRDKSVIYTNTLSASDIQVSSTKLLPLFSVFTVQHIHAYA